MSTDTEARYFAIADPGDAERMTYWRRVGGRLVTWPPAARYGPQLMRSDVPAGLKGQPRKEFIWAWQNNTLTPWVKTVLAAVEADLVTAAARFAEFSTRCCQCGRRLTDETSKTYGVGPECRSSWPDYALADMAERVSRAHALYANRDR